LEKPEEKAFSLIAMLFIKKIEAAINDLFMCFCLRHSKDATAVLYA
jgi:hypothetical protein